MFPRQIAVYCFALVLGYSAFAHGCVTDPAWYILDGGLVLGALLHFRRRLSAGEKLHLPWFPLVAMLLLLGLGVAQTLNPSHDYDPVTRDIWLLEGFRPRLPGTMDRWTTIIALIHWGALGIGFAGLIDLTRDRDAQWFLLGAIAVFGISLSIFGIALKFLGVGVIPFTKSPCNTFFGTYVYHAHAAAFLNLCWPASLVFVIRSMYGYQPLARAVWINGFLLTFVALFVNISKFGHLMALPGLIFALIVLRKGMPPREARVPPSVLVVIGLLLLGGVVTFAFPLAAVSVRRWDEVLQMGMGGRPILYDVAISIIRVYPWWGTGAGTFHIVFPFFTGHLGNQMPGLFSHAHQDYLQTIVEWGLPGALLWFALVGGGFLKGCREQWRRPGEPSSGVALVALSILGVHALIDFPMQCGSLRAYAAVYLAMLWRSRSSEEARRA
jgi:O-antigen ligase